jgi:hypothetical protein
MHKNKWRTVFTKISLLNILGILAALMVAEVSLRPFVTGRGGYLLPTEDSLEKLKNFQDDPSKTVEIRQYQEGYAAAHFAGDGARVTGNEKIENAPTGLIIGDSFVEALQVDDKQVMGSIIERLSREESKPFNVNQYGWGGTSTATYIAVADALIHRWNPKWVTVIYNNNDFNEQALKTGRFWRMDVAPEDLSVKLAPTKRSGDKYDAQLKKIGISSSDIYNLINSSSLLYAAVETYLLFGAPENDSVSPTKKDFTEEKTIAAASIKALKKAYGERLLIVYLPHIKVNSKIEPDEIESILQAVCQNEKVEFVSTRDAMVKELEERKRLSQGFSNTPPGIGHLNLIGHEIVGREIWRAVSKRP